MAAVLCGWPAVPAAAQTGTITGRVTGAADIRGVGQASVRVLSPTGAVVGRATTAPDGAYRVANVEAGVYTVEVAAVGYQPGRVSGVAVGAGTSVAVDVVLEARPVQLDAITVAGDRSQVGVKVTESPNEVHVVPTVEITDRPALTIVDHLKGLAGVDISQGGLMQSNVVGRGFNNIFSGALLMLIDNRFAAVPSLRVNVPAFFTVTDQDVQQVEFVLGPGAALYGPNTSNGVLAITTSSPLDASTQGARVWLESGFRSSSRAEDGTTFDSGAGLWRVGLRYAGALSPRVGFRISGEYFQGREWRMRDPQEPIPTPGRAELACNAETGCRDFDVEKYNVDARVDILPSDNTNLILSFGQSNAGSMIEYTGIGAGQARDWKYTYAQARFRWNRLFLQAFGNFSDAGNKDAEDRSGTFLLRTGQPIVDNSRVLAAQAQHAFDLGPRQTFTYGLDFSATEPRTEGTINGRNEDDDKISEIGGYVHSMTRLGPRVDLVGALRLDKHNRLDDARFSPRVALVFKPGEDQSLRVSFNQSFSTPSTNNLFLDIVAGTLPAPFSMNIRAYGVPEGGFQYRGYCGQGGVGNLCMRTQFPGGPADAVPALAAPMWAYPRAVALQLVLPQLPEALRPAVQGVLMAVPGPTPAQVGTRLRRWERTTANPAGIQWVDVTDDVVADIEPIKPTLSRVYEVGYKGIFSDKVRVSTSLWFERRKDFVGPLIVESPNVFLDPATTLGYLQATFQPALAQQLQQAGMPQAQAQATAAQVTLTISGVMTGVGGGNPLLGQAGVPVGTVVPNHFLASDASIFFTYRNFGQVDLWGSDISFDYLFTDRWSVSGAYSFVNKDFFTAEEADGPTDVALNAPRNKGAFAVRYAEGINGLATELRGRYVEGFPVNSGDYQTALLPDGTREKINDYTLVDGTVSYRFRGGLLASLTVQNVFNKQYQTLVGLPYLGRMVLTRLTYTF
jgi:outer membrane receptor for ferrienterochelin and colicins